MPESAFYQGLQVQKLSKSMGEGIANLQLVDLPRKQKLGPKEVR